MSKNTAAQTEAEATNDDATSEVPEHQRNDKRMADLMKTVGGLGREASLGRDSLPKLAHAVVKAASDGVIDADYKDDKGKDTATLLYEHYAKNESNKAIHEHSKAGVKANASKLRQLISMGSMTTIDGVAVMDEAFQAREAMKADDMKVKPAYVFYVDVARDQLKSDQPLSRDYLEELACKGEGAPKTVEEVLKAAEKLLEGLVTGEGKGRMAGLKDESDLTMAAAQAVRERIQQLQLVTKQNELRKAAAALGLTLA